jgi:hypothetical protein
MEEFSNRPFDDLRQEAITTKYKLDRSCADGLEASHIKYVSISQRRTRSNVHIHQAAGWRWTQRVGFL